MIPPAISSGRFGHQKVTIESPQFGDAGAMGDIAQSWLPIAENVPAEVTWLRGNKLLAARAVHAEATAEVVLRFSSAYTAQCRMIDNDGNELRILSFAADNLKRYITMLCKSVQPKTGI